MTQASTGLVKALARGGKVLSLAEMTAEDILAGVNPETKAALLSSAAASTPPAPAGAAGSMPEDGMPEDDKCSKCGDPMKDGKCTKCEPDASADAGASDAVAKARAEERNRFNAVMSSEYYKGREALAATMLGNDKLSADEIVTMLAAAAPSASGDDGDAKAGAALLAAMKASGNPDTGNASGNASNPSHPQQEANFGWDKIHAEIRERRGS